MPTSPLLYEAHFVRRPIPPNPSRGRVALMPPPLPVTGIVLVPSTETDDELTAYINRRAERIAAVRGRAVQTVDSMVLALTPGAMRIVGSTPAIDRLPHTRPARDCRRCQAIAATVLSPEQSKSLRQQLDIMCGRITHRLSEQAQRQLEDQINTYSNSR